MSKKIRILGAAILILPSLWVIWRTLWHLWYLYGSRELYSFGMNLHYGKIEIRDPWSDVLLLLCTFVATGCGVAVICTNRRGLAIWLLGVAMVAVVATGVIGMLLE